MAWRAPTVDDLRVKLSTAEIDAYTRDVTDDGTPADSIVLQTADMVRGYIAANRAAVLSPTPHALPDMLISPAMDYAAYDAARWRAASYAVGDESVAKGTSRFIALKSSPIWQAIGDGAGGFRDTLRNPYPPFAYSSGMGWVDVDRDTCNRLGLSLSGSRPLSDEQGAPSLSPGEADIADAIRRYGFPQIGEGLA